MDLLTQPFEIEDGQLVVSDRPGWGADIEEAVVAAHPLPAELGVAMSRPRLACMRSPASSR